MTTTPNIISTQIWYTNINDLNENVFILQDDELQHILTENNYQQIKRFIFTDDRKRALLSLFLQRRMIEETFNLNYLDYEILRIKEGKPYVRFYHDHLQGSPWNYNVSHHGQYVAIAADSNTLIGIDIVDITARSGLANGALELTNMFDSQLTTYEINYIQQQESEYLKYRMFYILWSLKESFVKAIGKGLGFNLLDVEFIVTINGEECSDIIQGSAEIRGVASYMINTSDWKFSFTSIDHEYLVTLANGPLSSALQSYQRVNRWDIIPNNSSNNKVVQHIYDIDMIYKSPIELLHDIL